MPKFREITGQFVGYIPDSIDSDIVPDRAPMSGRVTFTPVFTGGVIAFPELSPPEFAHPRTIHAKIVDGFVQVEVNEGEGDDEHIALQPLSLMVTVDDEASQVWSWRAEFDEILIGASDEYVKIPSWSFRVPDGTGPVDLTELVPLKTTGTVDVTKGPRGAGLQTITAVDGQLVFEYTDGEETTVPIPEAVQGPQGEPGPAGADGEQGPEGPQGPAGEIPDLLVGNIADATPTGKNLMLAATEGAARNALGLQTGATTIAGAYSELKPGSTQTNSRVWSPKNISDYVEERANEVTDAAKISLNVKDFGAVGDGIADDHPAIVSALEAIRDAGGGTLTFPRGTYFCNGVAPIYSNTTVVGDGAVIIKKAGQGVTMVFGIFSNGQTGYGSGAANVTFRNLHLRGDFAGKRQIGLVGANHADDVLVEGCTFEQAHMQGHILDLGGCRRVTVRDCTFIGQNVYDSVDSTKECVQADNSTRLGSSNVESAESYDGLPCEDIVVQDCRFLPLTIGSTVYPAPVPFGTHWALEDPHKRMVFEGNLVVDPPANGGAGYRGVLHFTNTESIRVSGNRFVSTSGTNESIIRNIPLTHTIDPSEAGTATGSTKTLATPLQCRNIEFSNNTITGFKAPESPQPLVNIKGSTGSSRVKGVVVSGNSFADAMSTGGPVAVEIYDADNVVVSGNTAADCRGFFATGRASRVSVSSNVLSGGAAGNTAILVQGDTSGVSVSSNSVATSGSGIAAQYSASKFSILGNSVAAGQTGISASSSTLNGVVSGNVASSISVSSSTVSESGNVVA